MIAIDTNIIVRFLTKDDENQYQKTYTLFANTTEIFIPTTVILETEWVLRFSYRLSIVPTLQRGNSSDNAPALCD